MTRAIGVRAVEGGNAVEVIGRARREPERHPIRAVSRSLAAAGRIQYRAMNPAKARE